MLHRTTLVAGDVMSHVFTSLNLKLGSEIESNYT